jgi:hypothetical protein
LKWGGADGGAKAFGVVNVFDADGNAVKWAAKSAYGGFGVAAFCFGEDGVAVDSDEGLDAGLDAVDVGEEGTGVLFARHLTAAYEGGGFRQREFFKI